MRSSGNLSKYSSKMAEITVSGECPSTQVDFNIHHEALTPLLFSTHVLRACVTEMNNDPELESVELPRMALLARL